MTDGQRIPWGGSVEEKLAFMQQRGSSVLLNWGEDTSLWECSWITSGERVTGIAVDMGLAVHRALQGGAS